MIQTSITPSLTDSDTYSVIDWLAVCYVATATGVSECG